MVRQAFQRMINRLMQEVITNGCPWQNISRGIKIVLLITQQNGGCRTAQTTQKNRDAFRQHILQLNALAYRHCDFV